MEVEQITAESAPEVARHRRRGALVRVIGTRRAPTDVAPALARAIEQDWPAVLDHLRDGRDLAVRDPLGNTLLHYGASWGNLPVVTAMVAAGVPVGFRNRSDRLAEELARERGHESVATWLACWERQAVVPPRRFRLRPPARIDGGRLVGPGCSMAVADITAVALSGPWVGGRRLTLAVGHAGADARPRSERFDPRDLAALGPASSVVEIPAAAPVLLWHLLPALIEREVPIGAMAVRWVELDGWTGRAAAARAAPPLTRRPVDVGVTQSPPLTESVTGVAVLPSGFFVVRSGPDGATETIVSWPTLLRVATDHAHDDRQLEVEMDQTFPWVAVVAAELRATGITGRHPVTRAAAPEVPADGTALHAHVLAGRPDLVEDLLATGFDPDRTDRFGRTALHLAMALGDNRSAAALLRHGAAPDACDDSGRTPSECASPRRAPAR